MSKKKVKKRTYSRKANWVGQAHLLPGMNLVKWRKIVADYPCQNFGELSSKQLDEIIRKIKEVATNAPRI